MYIDSKKLRPGSTFVPTNNMGRDKNEGYKFNQTSYCKKENHTFHKTKYNWRDPTDRSMRSE